MSDYEDGKHYVYDAASQTFHLADPEMEALFELQQEADQRAIKRWMEAHPDRPGVWPDRADMVVWLMEELEKVRDNAVADDAAFAMLQRRLAELATELDKLQDPNAVHINMLRGTIAKPSVEQIKHLYPELDAKPS